MTNKTPSAKRPWVPVWERNFWQDPQLLAQHAPFHQQNWAFSNYHGVPIMLEAKWTRLKGADGNTVGYRCEAVRNYNDDLPISWAVVQKAVADARKFNISLKEAVAKQVDVNDPAVPPIRFIKFAQAPDVMCAEEGAEEKKEDPDAKRKSDEFWSKIKGGTPKKASATVAAG